VIDNQSASARRRPGAVALLEQLRIALRRQRIGAAALAKSAGVGEATARRWLNGQGLTLDRLDQLCGIAGIDIRDLIGAAEAELAAQFTLRQERILAADRALAFLFFSILNGWQKEDFMREFGLPAARVEAHLARLVRLGLVDVSASGRARALTARAVRWRRGGPLAAAFENNIKQLYLSMDFSAPDARYVSDVVKLTEAARARVHALFEDLRRDIHRIAEQDRKARFEHHQWSAFIMLVRPMDTGEVALGFKQARVA